MMAFFYPSFPSKASFERFFSWSLFGCLFFHRFHLGRDDFAIHQFLNNGFNYPGFGGFCQRKIIIVLLINSSSFKSSTLFGKTSHHKMIIIVGFMESFPSCNILNFAVIIKLKQKQIVPAYLQPHIIVFRAHSLILYFKSYFSFVMLAGNGGCFRPIHLQIKATLFQSAVKQAISPLKLISSIFALCPCY